MKRLLRLFSFLLLFSYGCKSDDKTTTINRQDDLDVGRGFVRAILDGDYAKARTMMVQDSINLDLMAVYERSYKEKMAGEDKKRYKEASITVHELKPVNDSMSTLIYSNSYFKKDTHYLNILKRNQQWLVDFKSYFEERDSVSKDSIITGN